NALDPTSSSGVKPVSRWIGAVTNTMRPSGASNAVASALLARSARYQSAVGCCPGATTIHWNLRGVTTPIGSTGEFAAGYSVRPRKDNPFFIHPDTGVRCEHARPAAAPEVAR